MFSSVRRGWAAACAARWSRSGRSLHFDLHAGRLAGAPRRRPRSARRGCPARRRRRAGRARPARSRRSASFRPRFALPGTIGPTAADRRVAGPSGGNSIVIVLSSAANSDGNCPAAPDPAAAPRPSPSGALAIGCRARKSANCIWTSVGSSSIRWNRSVRDAACSPRNAARAIAVPAASSRSPPSSAQSSGVSSEEKASCRKRLPTPFVTVVDGGGEMAAAAAGRTDQQDARPACGGQFDLPASQPHGGPLADKSIGAEPCGGFLAKTADGFVQGDRVRFGGLGGLIGSRICCPIGRRQGWRGCPAAPRLTAAMGKKRPRRSTSVPSSAIARDRGGRNLARQTCRRRAERGGDGVGPSDGGAGMVCATCGPKALRPPFPATPGTPG